MKAALLSFIPLIAVIVHATPTIRNDHIEPFPASDSLDGLAHRRENTVSCIYCPGPAKPFCRECPDRLGYKSTGPCISGHKRTCAYSGGLPSDGISCGKGYWGCILSCCEDSQGKEEPSIPLTNGNIPSTYPPNIIPAGAPTRDPAATADIPPGMIPSHAGDPVLVPVYKLLPHLIKEKLHNPSNVF